MSYNIWLLISSMLYILATRTCVVSGLVIEAVPGHNLSLACMVDQVNDQQTIKWWAHNSYISSGKMIYDSLSSLKAFFALPGAGADYSLFIMILDDITIWPYLVETYECRLVLSNDNDFQVLQTYELQIYQPECTIFQINGSTSVASCSYQNIPEFQTTVSIDGSVHSVGDCTSDVCVLNYTFNPREVNSQDLVCSVRISSRTFVTKTCTMQNTYCNITTKKNLVLSTSLTTLIAAETSLDTVTTPINSGIQKENSTNTDVPDSNQGQGFRLQFIIATACTSTAIFILFIIKFYKCYKKKVNNTNNQSTVSLETMDVSNQLSGGTDFPNRNTTKQQSRTDITLSKNSQNVQNKLYQESNTAMQTSQQVEDNTALYHKVREVSDATYQMHSIVNDVNYINYDQDNGGYLEVTA